MLVLLNTDVFSVFVKWITVVFALLGVKYLIVVYSKSAYLYFIRMRLLSSEREVIVYF